MPFETLRRIYAKAVALAPETAWNHASFGISAGEYASVEPDEPAAARLWALAHAELELAAQLDPDDASIAAAQGYAAYMDGACAREDALRALDRAIALDPRQPWASLYRAHVLHDLERWSEAAQAYDRVPKDAFDGPRSWRMDLLVEQRAFCSLRAGDLRGAREGFERILARYEVQPHLAQWGQLVYLSKAADEALPELRERVDVLARRLDAS